MTKTRSSVNRRQFVRLAGTAAAAAAGGGLVPRAGWAASAPAILPMKSPNAKIQIAVVGLSGISSGHLASVSREEHLVALCECRKAALDAKVEWIKTLDTLELIQQATAA